MHKLYNAGDELWEINHANRGCAKHRDKAANPAQIELESNQVHQLKDPQTTLSKLVL